MPRAKSPGSFSASPSHPREGEAFEGRQPQPLRWQAGPSRQASSSRTTVFPRVSVWTFSQGPWEAANAGGVGRPRAVGSLWTELLSVDHAGQGRS